MPIRPLKPACLALSLLASSVAFALSDAEKTDIYELITSPPDVRQYQAAFNTYPSDTLEVLEVLLSNTNTDPSLALQTAFQTRPDLAVQIAGLARKLYFQPNLIVSSAVLAGIDPTSIAQPTAAGNQLTSSVTNNDPTNRSLLSSGPSLLATGSNGGGGLDVISPN